MVIFFFVVGLEIKREVTVGELASPRRAALPIAGALGGMVLPAVLYSAFNASGPGAAGWGIPMATDIAFTLVLLIVLGRRVPLGLRVFFTALAIADDLGAVLVIALFYSSGISWPSLGVALVLFLALLGLNRARVYAVWPYGLLGIALWRRFCNRACIQRSPACCWRSRSPRAARRMCAACWRRRWPCSIKLSLSRADSRQSTVAARPRCKHSKRSPTACNRRRNISSALCNPGQPI